MSEHNSNQHEVQFEPRGKLFERLHDFFVAAVAGQARIDERARLHEAGTLSPGSLYKLDGGFLKIHLQPPAPDFVMSTLSTARRQEMPELPYLWVQMPLKDCDEDLLLDEVLATDVILMHVQPPGAPQPEVGYEVTPDRFKRLGIEEVLDASTILNVPFDTEGIDNLALEEMFEASRWLDLLKEYDLRSITANGETAA